ncbi:hypothetical protein B0H16DRAFT_1542925 [Mycena metata]|uniref:Uncharacterized protein n=1 Tax=Mycena metata TaxID=1033252 RepID=A0AAD7NBC4_9AGAR|nr:hypothetical protein B0H16DRAFT_1542925 [Mycena metata]
MVRTFNSDLILEGSWRSWWINCKLLKKQANECGSSGSVDTLLDQSNYYDQIVQRYRWIIAGQLLGHTHRVCAPVSRCAVIPPSYRRTSPLTTARDRR